ncbi:MAG: hypothetical protein ACLU37_09515 [Collinsella sp.]
MRAEAEGKDPHEAVAAANGEDAVEDEALTRAMCRPTPSPLPMRPPSLFPPSPGVPSFDDEPQVAIDTEGAVAENHEASAAVFGGAATVPAGPAHEGGLPLVDGAGETRVPRWPCRLCLRSRPTRLSPSRTCAFAVRR